MRSGVTLAAVCGAIAAVALAGQEAKAGSFCLSDREGRNDCSFATLAQCQASASGTDAACYASPYAVLPQQAPVPPAVPAQGRRNARGGGGER